MADVVETNGQTIEYNIMLPAFSWHLPTPSASIAWWADDTYRGGGRTLYIEGIVKKQW